MFRVGHTVGKVVEDEREERVVVAHGVGKINELLGDAAVALVNAVAFGFCLYAGHFAEHQLVEVGVVERGACIRFYLIAGVLQLVHQHRRCARNVKIAPVVRRCAVEHSENAAACAVAAAQMVGKQLATVGKTAHVWHHIGVECAVVPRVDGQDYDVWQTVGCVGNYLIPWIL